MNDNVKTLIFVGVAVAIVAAAFLTGPRAGEEAREGIVGQDLVKEFDPLKAGRLEIVEFDEPTASVKPFSVERKKVGEKLTWVIPSHQNYPTDAQSQLADAATSLMGLKVLEVKTESPGDHATYGVLDPDPKVRKPGDTGVGKRVTIWGDDNKELAALVIGKPLEKDSDLHFVRRTGDDRVAVVKIRTDKLTTDFSKWIEKDLLKLSPWDIEKIRINDYSADLLQRVLDMRRRMLLDYNDTGDPRWTLAMDKVFNPETGEWKDVALGEDEELNTAKLDDMKNALDDLKIVDVERKPEGLTADLKAKGDVVENEGSLVARGFVLADAGDGRQLYSSKGEIVVTMKDGVEYVLRFGEVTGEESKKEDGDEKADEKPSGMNRFLFVMTQFNEDAIERPTLEEEPKAEEKPADEKPADEKPADEMALKPDEAKSDAADEKKEDEKKADEKKDDKSAEIERIREENKRKLDEYEEKKKKGREKVKELNDRFADWYYHISNSEFEKIHLGRDQIVKAKEAKDEQKDGEPGHGGDDHAGDMKQPDDVEKFDEMKNAGPAGP